MTDLDRFAQQVGTDIRQRAAVHCPACLTYPLIADDWAENDLCLALLCSNCHTWIYLPQSIS